MLSSRFHLDRLSGLFPSFFPPNRLCISLLSLLPNVEVSCKYVELLSRIADKGWSSSLEFGQGPNNSSQ